MHWLRCEIPDGPRQALRIDRVREMASGLCGPDSHFAIEIAPGRVFCDLYCPERLAISFVATAMRIATGETFVHRRTFPDRDGSPSPTRPSS
jgi:hypothetical protein